MQFKVENVSYKYKNSEEYALKNISLSLNNGMNFLIGKNGSGKSTFINILNGIYKPEGDIYLNEINIKEYKDLKKDVAIVYQFSDDQIFNVTVKEELFYAVRKRNLNKDMVNEKIIYYFDVFNLDINLLNKNPFKLSGGEKKKIAIITMLILEPKVLILDEPTIGLDTFSRSNLMESLKRISKEITILIISHNIEDVYEYADYIIELENGELKKKEEKNLFFKNLYKENSSNLPEFLKLKRKLGIPYEEKISEEDLIIKIKERYELY